MAEALYHASTTMVRRGRTVRPVSFLTLSTAVRHVPFPRCPFRCCIPLIRVLPLLYVRRGSLLGSGGVAGRTRGGVRVSSKVAAFLIRTLVPSHTRCLLTGCVCVCVCVCVCAVCVSLFRTDDDFRNFDVLFCALVPKAS